jgi:hypothetical protein
MLSVLPGENSVQIDVDDNKRFLCTAATFSLSRSEAAYPELENPLKAGKSVTITP